MSSLTKMLPTVLLTLAASFSWNADASPVYNMQPAYITANIGTTGRNIRNLPCISRKTNQNGVCMFAIDCLKANGTHLGTCIDRFYFGSCCHIEPTHDIIDNSIETSIFPGREPPNRLNATEKPTTRKPTTTTRPPIILTKEPGMPDTTTEVSYKLTTFQSVDGNANEVQTTTFRPPIIVSHKPKPPVLEKKPPPLTTKPPSLTRPTTLKTTPAPPSKPFARPTQARPKPTPTAKPIKITKPPYKPLVTTKQPSKPLKQSAKPTKTTTRRPTTKFTPKITQKPSTSTTPQSISVTTQKIENISLMETISRLPSPETTTQIANFSTETTPKTPEIITKRPETKPSTLETKPSSLETKPSTPVTKPSTPETISSKQPEATTSTIPEVTSTTSKPLEITSKIPDLVTLEVTTKSTTAKVDQTTSTPTSELNSTISSILTTTVTSESSSVGALTSKPSEASGNDSLPSNDVFLSNLNMSAVLGAVNGNVATNEIESVKPIVVETTTVKTLTTTTTTGKPSIATTPTTTTTTLATTTKISTTTSKTTPSTTTTPKTTTTTTEKPGLITWTLPDENQPTSVANTTSEDWIPITTPDGWVLLPSVTTSTESSPTVLPTLPSPVNFTQEPSQVTTDKIAENVTVSLVPETSTQAANFSHVNATESVEAMNSTTESIGPTTELSQETALNMSDFTNVCGRRMYPEGRIVGGEKSNYGKWPWQISLRQWRTSTYLHKCGAALLNENWAITAAHCVDNVPPSDLLLRLGEHDLSTDLEPYLHQERRVQIVASHPQFDPRTFEYDLALLRFYEPVKFQPNIIPVCVPQTEENFVGRTAYVTGWGRLYEDGPLPSVLQEVSVPVINNTLCESMYRMAGYIEHIPHIFICAGWRRGGFDSCEGDSGGPMVIQREDKRFLLAGVISWGIGCAEPNQPGVYTRISEFRDWINQILQF